MVARWAANMLAEEFRTNGHQIITMQASECNRLHNAIHKVGINASCDAYIVRVFAALTSKESPRFHNDRKDVIVYSTTKRTSS